MFVYIFRVPEEEPFGELLLEGEGSMLKTNLPKS